MSNGTSKVSIVVTNRSSSAAPTAGSASGNEIRRSVRQLPAPVMVEASSSRGSMAWKAAASRRSEEHTSELQSQFHLVCRLLLEKTKNIPIINILNGGKHAKNNIDLHELMI